MSRGILEALKEFKKLLFGFGLFGVKKKIIFLSMKGNSFLIKKVI